MTWMSYQSIVDAKADGEPSTFAVFATTAYVRRDGVGYEAFNQLTPNGQ